MESHSLNLAHQQYRRAEILLMNHRYDEAIQCHHNAAEYLIDAMKSTKSSVALESMSLQHSYHLKQKDLISNKKEQYTRVKKTIDQVKLLSKDQILNPDSDDYKNLQIAIYRAINESEAILSKINHEDSHLDTGNQDASKDVTDGNAQHSLVKDYQAITQNLHCLIEQLVLQVVFLKDENNALKERSNYLEKERLRYLLLPLPFQSDTISDLTSVFRPQDRDLATEKDPTGLSKPLNDLVIDTEKQQSHFDLSAFTDN